MGNVSWLYEGVGISENIWCRGERTSSGVRGSVIEIWTADVAPPSNSDPKMSSNSVRNIEKTGAGMLRVGEKTMPTETDQQSPVHASNTQCLPLRTVILLTSELLTMLKRKAERALSKDQFACGSLRTSPLYAEIFLSFSSRSGCPSALLQNGIIHLTYQVPVGNPDAALE